MGISLLPRKTFLPYSQNPRDNGCNVIMFLLALVKSLYEIAAGLNAQKGAPGNGLIEPLQCHNNHNDYCIFSATVIPSLFLT